MGIGPFIPLAAPELSKLNRSLSTHYMSLLTSRASNGTAVGRSRIAWSVEAHEAQCTDKVNSPSDIRRTLVDGGNRPPLYAHHWNVPISYWENENLAEAEMTKIMTARSCLWLHISELLVCIIKGVRYEDDLFSISKIAPMVPAGSPCYKWRKQLMRDTDRHRQKD